MPHTTAWVGVSLRSGELLAGSGGRRGRGFNKKARKGGNRKQEKVDARDLLELIHRRPMAGPRVISVVGRCHLPFLCTRAHIAINRIH